MKYIFGLVTLFFSFLFSNNLQVEQYKLENGMTVMLNEDKEASGVYGVVIVKGGGKQDPSDATGIAHYLEHMLFKGTTELGTVDFKKEKVYLDSIALLYDNLGLTKSEDKRLEIQKKINDLNLKASEYAIPNEFDRILEGMGGTGINAFTSNDVIAYFNQFPPHQIKKWLEVNSHRFINPVFRLFQSELEVVYEEKNRAMDNPFRKLIEEYFEHFWKKHPYGQQTVLGTVDHLKNPSLTKMREYYDKYYVANNMYLLLAGNFQSKNIKPHIESTFGRLKSGPNPKFVNVEEEPFNGREVVKNRLTPVRFGILGYRVPPNSHEDSEKIQVIKNLLNNRSSTGLLDRLSIENKLTSSSAIDGFGGSDHGSMAFIFIPKLVFQTFRGAENQVLKQIEKIKRGDFSEEFLESVKLSMIQDYETGLEDVSNRLSYALEVVNYNKTWEDIFNYPESIESIQKRDVVQIANKYFNNNYLVYQSRMGFPKKVKLDKPPFKAIKAKNSEKVSSYRKKLENLSEDKIEYNFINIERDMQYEEISDNYHLYHNMNPKNSIFTMKVEYGIGTKEDPALKYAAELGNMIGNEKYSFNVLKEELQKIGATINFYSSGDYFGLDIKGFDKNFEKTMNMAGDFLQNLKVRKEDKKKLKKLIQSSTLERMFEGRDASTKGNALRDYALWGQNSNWLKRSTIKEVKKMDTDFLLEKISAAMKYETTIFFTGTLDFNVVKTSVKKNLTLNNRLKKSSSPIVYEQKLKNKNTIYFYNDKKAVQSQIHVLIPGSNMALDERLNSRTFNKYFGSGMSALVFQEIREFRSLAYSAYGVYQVPWYLDGEGHFRGYMGTQTDKTVDAIEAYLSLLRNMPEKPLRMEGIKSGLLQSLVTSKPNFRSLARTARNWKLQGYDSNPNILYKDNYESIDFKNVVNFYEKNLKDKPYTIAIVGNREKIDMQKLADFGELIEVDKNDIFN